MLMNSTDYSPSPSYFPQEHVSNPLSGNPLQTAKKTAGIVSDGVRSGDFTDMNRLLDQIAAPSRKSQFVFDCDSVFRWLLPVAGCVVFTAIFIYLLIISFGTTVFSNAYRAVGIAALIMSILAIGFNVFFVLKAFREIQFARRYRQYQKLLQYHTVVFLKDLSVAARVQIKQVYRDLNKAIDSCLIPQGHFGTNHLIFIVSDEAYRKYRENQSAFDRYYKKMLADRDRSGERSAYVQNILDSGKDYVAKIHSLNDLIKDKVITEKLNRMEQIVATIFSEVDINPKQADKLGMLINYYLPTTEKLLEAYVDLSEKQVQGRSVQKTQKEIEDAIDKINRAYSNILDQIFQEQEMDVASDISALSVMMRQDGLDTDDEDFDSI